MTRMSIVLVAENTFLQKTVFTKMGGFMDRLVLATFINYPKHQQNSLDRQPKKTLNDGGEKMDGRSMRPTNNEYI